jgi:glycosyltransferase involved in cell wall biosynthesis
LSSQFGRLVVVPTDPFELAERTGYDWLERYFNPAGAFREVFALSPLEEGERRAHGMTIRGVSELGFAEALREIQPDVVRAYGGFWPSDLVCRRRLAGTPVVVSVHDPNPSLLHESICYADLVICMSKAVERAVIALGASPERTRVLPNRVDTSVFRPIRDEVAHEELNRRFPRGRHLLHVGRRSREKNLDTLIRALAVLPSDYSGVFVGLGDRSEHAALAATLGVSERCFWIDAIKNSELPIWYSWCDAMCNPSRWEGFGIVFIEAAACGAPIITSNIAPMNEYLEHGVSAHLVDAFEDPAALARAVRQVCEDAGYREALGRGAVDAAKPFERHAIDAAEVELYREAIELGPTPLSRRLEIALWRAKFAVPLSLKPAWARRIARAAGIARG